MKTLILSCLMVLATILAKGEETKNKMTAKASVAGVVVDHETQESLVGVKVELEGTGLVCYTDFDGNYAFENLEPGKYNLQASYVSYNKTELKSINTSANGKQNISLKAAN